MTRAEEPGACGEVNPEERADGPYRCVRPAGHGGLHVGANPDHQFSCSWPTGALVDAERQIAEAEAALRRACGDVPIRQILLPAHLVEHFEIVDGDVRRKEKA